MIVQVCPSKTVGMCGYSTTTIGSVVAAGYRAIFNDYANYYLGMSSGTVTWDKVYEVEPLAGIDDPEQQKLVLGAEICKWVRTCSYYLLLRVVDSTASNYSTGCRAR